MGNTIHDLTARVHSFILQGIDAIPCEIEVDLTPGLPCTSIVGLPDAAVRESSERVRAAISNSGHRWPACRITVNLAPASVRKEGPVFDLAIAMALLLADGSIRSEHRDRACPGQLIVAGELALDGRTRPVRGVVAMVELARRTGAAGVIVPRSNLSEAIAVGGVPVFGVDGLNSMVRHFKSVDPPVPESEPDHVVIDPADHEVDFSEIKSQESAKRALMIAATGGHNILLVGPPGCGKTMLANAMTGILPPLDREEAIEITRIHSAAGLIDQGRGLVRCRPFRRPHHTISTSAMVGGGSIPRPGEVTLAHHGILFLDELPEFARAVLDSLREPLQDRSVTISRVHGSVRFPSDPLLVAAMNPGRDGRIPQNISLALLDRIDMHVRVPSLPMTTLSTRASGLDSETMSTLVSEARLFQGHGRPSGRINARLTNRMLDDEGRFDDDGISILVDAMKTYELSARSWDRIRRVACSIADLDSSRQVRQEHVAEAIGYRLLDHE